MNKNEYSLWATRPYSIVWNQGFCEYCLENGCEEIDIIPVGDDKADYVVLEPSFSNACHKIGLIFIKGRFIDEYEKRKADLLQISKKLSESVNKASDQELKKTFLNYWEKARAFQPYMMFPHYSERELEPLIKSKFADNFDIIASTPKSFEYMNLQRDLFELPINEVLEKYSYLAVYGMTEKPYDEEYFKEFKKTINKSKLDESFEEIIKNNKLFDNFVTGLNEEDKRLCELLHQFVFVRTDRIDTWKKHAFLLYPFIEYVVKKISKKLTIREGSMLTRDEILDILDGKFNVKESDLLERGKRLNVMVSYTKSGIIFESRKDEIDKIKRAYVSDAKTEQIRGISACKGIVKGEVKLYFKDKDINDSDKDYILVCRHTSPQDILYMKKARAIVTDEGGITSHAAIVSRELGIPCIVGTKIATKLLRDRMQVEVNATKGIVTILGKQERLNTPKKGSYVFICRFKELPYLISDLFMQGYAKHKPYYCYVNGFWYSYFTKESYGLALDEGLTKIKEDGWVKNFEFEYNSLVNKSSDFKIDLDKTKKLTKSKINNFFDYLKLLLQYYYPLEHFFTDKAFAESEKNESLRPAVNKMGELKNFFREKLNEIVLYPNSLTQQYLQRISENYNVPFESLYFYSAEEISKIPEGVRLSRKEIQGRSSKYAMYYDGEKYNYCSEKEADKIIEKIHEEPISDNVLKGISANKGKITAKARVLEYTLKDFGKTENLINSMQKGEILVTETTGPEIIKACNKAIAIITDEGGLLSHAAIISRELKIPCIVGTKFATSTIKTGDLLEVDADNGTVTILSKEDSGEATSLINEITNYKWHYIHKRIRSPFYQFSI